MIFELHKLKYTAMKKLFIIISTLMVISSCATNKEANSSRIELRNEKKLAEQAIVKKAVESRRFIIKLERLYFFPMEELSILNPGQIILLLMA